MDEGRNEKNLECILRTYACHQNNTNPSLIHKICWHICSDFVINMRLSMSWYIVELGNYMYAVSSQEIEISRCRPLFGAQ